MREEGQRACRPADQAKCGIAEETPSRSRARSSRRATLPSAAWFPFMVSAAFLFVTRAPPASMDALARRRRCRRAWRPSASSLPDWRVDDPWPKRPSSRFCFVVRPLNVLPGRPRASDRTLPGAALLPAAGIATVRHRLNLHLSKTVAVTLGRQAGIATSGRTRRCRGTLPRRLVRWRCGGWKLRWLPSDRAKIGASHGRTDSAARPGKSQGRSVKFA